MFLNTLDRLEWKGVQGIHYKRRSLLCSGTYTGQLLWVTVLYEWQAGILMVSEGRKDGWEERPRPPNPGWKIG